MENTYNGWKNRQTWNVALCINNDEYLYTKACKFMCLYGISSRTGKRILHPYIAFVRYAGLEGERTPDNISYTGTRLDYKALDEMISGLYTEISK